MLRRAKLHTDPKNNFRNCCKVWKKEERICLCESPYKEMTAAVPCCSDLTLGSVSRLKSLWGGVAGSECVPWGLWWGKGSPCWTEGSR